MVTPTKTTYDNNHSSNSSSDTTEHDPDDWTKLTDVKLRRKIQNRLAQRNRRRNIKRQQELAEQQQKEQEESLYNEQFSPMKQGFYPVPDNLNHTPNSLPETPYPPQSAGLPDTTWSQFSPQQMCGGWPVTTNEALPLLSPPMTISGDPQDMAAELYCQQLLQQEQNEIVHRLSCSMDKPMGIYMTPTPEMNTPQMGFPQSDSPVIGGLRCDTMGGHSRHGSGAEFNNNNNYTSGPYITPPSAGPDIEDLDAMEAFGCNGVHLAVQKGHLSIVRLLLETDIDINARNAAGLTALHIAIIEGKNVMAQFLLEHGANSDILTSSGKSTLHLAVESGNPTLVQLLLDYGGDPNMKDYSGQTALHTAVINGQEEIVRVMLQKGADTLAQVGR